MLRLLTDATTDSTGSSLTEPAAKQLNALQKWWQNIDWEAIVGILIQKVLMLLFDYFIWYFAENQQLCHRTNLSFLREKEPIMPVESTRSMR